MKITRIALRLYAPMARAFERSTKDPRRTQEKVLLKYLSRNALTEFGRKYNFRAIRSISGYQAAVPIGDSETMRPLVERMASGEQNILTRDRPIFFGATSGTTSHAKLIPATEFSGRINSSLIDLWSYYIVRDHPDVMDGKILSIISPEIEGYTPSGVAFGAESGRAYKHLPLALKHLYVLPYEVFEIKDYDARYYTILRISIEQDITDIATINPNTLILLCHKIANWQDMIIADIENGTLSKKFEIDDRKRRAIERTLRANPKRASELGLILKEVGKLLPRYFWPNLELIECWKGGTVSIYLKELPVYFGSVAIRDLGCLSTEARSSIPISDEGAGGVLAIQTNFYEFIPREDISKRKKRVLLADELERGKDYFIVVTTPGGLYRYNMDDIIRVDGFFNKTPIIEFLQKGLYATSLAGEKLYESQVNAALNSVLTVQKHFIEFFSSYPRVESTSRYVFLVEFENALSPGEKKDFIRAMDAALRHENREYDFVRDSQLLDSPVLKIVGKGSYEKYKARRLAEGAHEGQFKVPELTRDSDFEKNFEIEEVVTL